MQNSYIFSQLVKFLDRNHFNHLVRKYDGDRYVKYFTCWNHLLVMIFGQLCYRESLRDLVNVVSAHKSKSYHLGFGKNVSKTNLAYANNQRDYHIFEDYAYYLVEQARRKRATDIFRLGGNVYAFDSTTIDLCLSIFWWATFYDIETQLLAFFHITEAAVYDSKAMDVIPYETGAYYVFDRGYNDFKQLYHITEIGSFFVIRAKKNMKYKAVKWKRKLPKNVLSDAEIELTGFYPKRYYPTSLRLIRYHDEEQNRGFMFLTNALSITALQVANLYKKQMASGTIFQVAKTAFENQKIWGCNRKCRLDSNLLRNLYLLSGGDCATRYAIAIEYIRDAPNFRCIVNRQLPFDRPSSSN